MEHPLAVDVVQKLNHAAALAERCLEMVEVLGAEALGSEERISQRHPSEVEERRERRTADPAARHGLVP